MTTRATESGDGGAETEQPSPSHISVFSLSALGDLLVAVPVFSHARRIYPGARISVVCERGGTAALARELGIADDVVLLKPGARKSPLTLRSNLQRLRALAVDMALQTLASHGTYGNLLIGATGAAVRCGFEAGRFTDRLTHRVPIRPGLHYVTQNLDLLRRLGHHAIEDPADRFLPPLEGRAPLFADKSPRDMYGRYVLISTGCDPRLFFKRWPDRHWIDLIRRIGEQKLNCVLVGDEPESARIETLLAGAGAGVNLAGRTSFSDLAALVRHAEAVIGIDGMVLHLAAAMSRPCLALFGPTDPSEVGPFGDIHQVARLNLPCSPCYGFHSVGKGISCRTYECMNHLAPDIVFGRLCRILRSGPDS